MSVKRMRKVFLTGGVRVVPSGPSCAQHLPDLRHAWSELSPLPGSAQNASDYLNPPKGDTQTLEAEGGYSCFVTEQSGLGSLSESLWI